MNNYPTKRNRQVDSRGMLFGCSLVLLCLAVILPIFVPPTFAKIPFDVEKRIEVEGTVRILELVDVDNQDFPVNVTLIAEGQGGHDNQVKITEKAKFYTVLSEQNVVVRELAQYFLSKANFKNDSWDKLKLVFGDEETEDTFWVDRRDASYISPQEAQGAQWILPPAKVKKQDYELWDNITGSKLDLKYVEEDKYEGLKVYKFQAPLNIYDLGSFEIPRLGQRVRLDATGQLDIWVEEESGLIVYGNLNLNIFAQAAIVRIDVLQMNFQPKDTTQSEMVQLAKKARNWLKFSKLWGPVLLGGTGLICLASLRQQSRIRKRRLSR